MKLNTGKRYKRQPPLTKEQQAIIEEWHRSAVRMAQAKRHSFHQQDDLHSIAHDSLIQAVRYYDPAKGLKFGAFLNWIIRRKMFRSPALRARKNDAKLQLITQPFPEDFEPIQRPGRQVFEDREFVTHLRSKLTPSEERSVILIFDRGLTVKDAAAESGISPTAMRVRRDKAIAKMRLAAGDV